MCCTNYDAAQESVARECAGLRWGDFKPRLAEAVVEHLAPLQQRYQEVTQDPAVLEQVLLLAPCLRSWLHNPQPRPMKALRGFMRGGCCTTSKQAPGWSGPGARWAVQCVKDFT